MGIGAIIAVTSRETKAYFAFKVDSLYLVSDTCNIGRLFRVRRARNATNSPP